MNGLDDLALFVNYIKNLTTKKTLSVTLYNICKAIQMSFDVITVFKMKPCQPQEKQRNLKHLVWHWTTIYHCLVLFIAVT